MAQRDLTTFREVTQVPADISGEQMVSAVLSAGQEIQRIGTEAKIAESMSAMQLDMQKMQAEYRVKYEADPAAGIAEYKKARDQLANEYGSKINPFYRGQWNAKILDMSSRDNLSQEAWSIDQGKRNVVQSVNTSVSNYLKQAMNDGLNYGTTNGGDIQAVLNNVSGRNDIYNFAKENLGEITAQKLLTDFDNDYVKTFVSGVGDSNPRKAMSLLDDEAVKAKFNNPEQWLTMRNAMERRAEIADRKAEERNILSSSRGEAALLQGSGSKSYSDLATEMEKIGVSDDVKQVVMRLNGFGEGQKKLNNIQKETFKIELYKSLEEMLTGENTSTADVAAFQTQIFKAMNNGAITDKEGAEWINKLAAPAIAAKEKGLEDFSDTQSEAWLDDLGFVGIKNLVDEKMTIKPDEGEDTLTPTQQLVNNSRRIKIYDYYMAALNETAGSAGLTLDKIQGLDEGKRRKIYNDAQSRAVEMYASDISPAISLIPESPDAVLRDGQLISVPKTREGTSPKISTSKPFEVVYRNGFYARRYEDGTFERIN